MIELREATKRYPARSRGAEPVLALDRVSLRFAEGELAALVGPSGGGKSTLLRLLNRLIEPDGGEVLLRGRPLRELDPVRLRLETGYAIQGVGLFPHLSVARNVGLVPELLGWDRRRIELRVEELLDLVRLPRAFAGRMPRELSGGEAQRVGVARALAAGPPLLLMDEPFGALDALTRGALQEDFDAIRRRLGTTVVLVTHDLAEAFRLADRVVVLRAGRVAREGFPAELAEDPGDPLVEGFLEGLAKLERITRRRLP